jgi:hypothetical protein
VEAHEEHLFDVPQVTNDLVGRPILAVWPSHEDGLTVAANRAGEIIGCAGHAVQTLLKRLLGDLL